jgi:hypothetical protein
MQLRDVDGNDLGQIALAERPARTGGRYDLGDAFYEVLEIVETGRDDPDGLWATLLVRAVGDAEA